jgi:prepilin-type N-terminal cleavage/methylation domain-containing protein
MAAFRFRQTHAFTLTELMIALAIVSLLAAAAAVLFPRYIERAKTTEADIAVADVKRLENDFFARTGTYSSDLKEIGYQPVPALKYHTVYVQVEQAQRGWSYMVLAMPNDQSQTGGRYVSQAPDGAVSNIAGLAVSGAASACGAWSGWGSMQGGRIEGEEGLYRSSNGTPPCGSRKVVDHGRSSGSAVSAH